MSTIPGRRIVAPPRGVSFGGVVERNWYLIKRYFWWELAFFVWSLANTLTITFIAKGIEAAGGQIDVNRATTTLLIGAVIWSYLGIVFEFMTETVAVGALGGDDRVHLHGTAAPLGAFVRSRCVRRPLRRAAQRDFVRRSRTVFQPGSADANFLAALLVLTVASVSFMGIGTMTSVLPLISPEKGAQLGFVAQGMLLVISGVYYPVTVLPEWMQWLSTISPATYALRGIRAALLDGAGFGAIWADIWPLLIIGAVAMPLGLWIFRRGEIYAKKHGKLKRSG